MDKVDATMATVAEQRELANEVADAISNPMYGGMELDEVRLWIPCASSFLTHDHIEQSDLKSELEELEQDALNERLMGAEHVPIHNPGGISHVQERKYNSHSCCGIDTSCFTSPTSDGRRRRRGRTAQGAASCSCDVTTSHSSLYHISTARQFPLVSSAALCIIYTLTSRLLTVILLSNTNVLLL